jgi:UDP-N-acetylglucosamine acyltransferase
MANKIHPTAIIGDNVILGDNNVIGPYCVIGEMAEHKKCKELGKVIIGNNNVITGLVSIDAGTEWDTIIEDNCYIMKHAHIGHDCIIESNVTISCGAKIGGHTIIRQYCNIGLNAVIHQKQDISAGCMIGASAMVTKKLMTQPFKKYAGVPAKEIGSNEGLRSTIIQG